MTSAALSPILHLPQRGEVDPAEARQREGGSGGGNLTTRRCLRHLGEGA